MLLDRIIQLSDGTQYYVVKEKEVDNKKYILLVHCDLEKDVADEELVLQELIMKNNTYETRNVDENVAVKVLKEMLN